ncbi:MAG: hypothetical protein CMJ72_06225 [Planctomycetaceae bacterium]|nr:hypothetical protein [Planctomycetaceae bacterium]
MKKIKVFVLALAAVCLADQLASAALFVTEVQPSSDHSEDWFELTNAGAAAVDLENYYWDDNGPSGADGALFPALTIGAGESIVIVRTDTASLPAFVDSWGGGFTAYSEDIFGGPDTFSGLSSGGDQIEIWDADPNTASSYNLVASAYFGDAPGNGHTFEWNTSGGSIGLSVVGEHGAYGALHDGEYIFPSSDVGSPGIATSVPEPNSMALVALGLLGLIGTRRL